MRHDQWEVRSPRLVVRHRNYCWSSGPRLPNLGRRHGFPSVFHVLRPHRVRFPLACPGRPVPARVPLHPRQREPGRSQRPDPPPGRVPPVPPAGRHLGARRQSRHGALGTAGHRPRTRRPRPGDVRQLRRRRRKHLRAGSGRGNGRDLHLHQGRGGAVPGVQHRSRPLLETLRRQPCHPQRRSQGFPRPEGFLARADQVVGDGGLPRRPNRRVPLR